MSTIEPTVTRTMRCTSCNAVGVHTIDASMRSEAVLCPACAESGKRSTCVATPIEPTEEQMQAAGDLYSTKELWLLDGWWVVDHIARLLAEREAKLTAARDALIAAHADDLRQGVAANAELRAMVERLKAQVSALHKDAAVVAVHREAKRVQARTEADTLRARVAELEHWERIAGDRHHHAVELECREAQHLADIRAAKDALEQARPSVEAWVTSDAEDVDSDADALQAIDEVLARLAHYDDAKAAEGGEG